MGLDDMSDETKTSETSDEIEAGAAKPAPQDERPERADGPAPTVEELLAELAECRDQVLRAAAEMDNTRKRAAREISDSRTYAVTSFARDIVSVGDNLARAISALTPEMRASMGVAGHTLLDGIEITERELLATLARHGVKPIDVGPGSAFDPHLHQAAAQIPSELPVGKVVHVMQPGWTIGDRVLRAAVVAVSAGPNGSESNGAAPSAPAEA
jgi:molecular chaperone GrpE